MTVPYYELPDANELPLILLVEDREDDILLVQKAFQSAKITTTLQIVRDGEEAVAYLSGSGKYSNREEYPLPWLVLLDLKMPRLDGFEVLTWIRQQPGFNTLVLTSSEQIRDVNLAYSLRANSFMVKPQDFQNAVGLADLINMYWLQYNAFPESPRHPRPKVNGGKEV